MTELKIKEIEKLVQKEIDRQVADLEKSGTIKKLVDDQVKEYLEHNFNNGYNDFADEIVDDIDGVARKIVNDLTSKDFELTKAQRKTILDIWTDQVSMRVEDDILDNADFNELEGDTMKLVGAFIKGLQKQLKTSNG